MENYVLFRLTEEANREESGEGDSGDDTVAAAATAADEEEQEERDAVATFMEKMSSDLGAQGTSLLTRASRIENLLATPEEEDGEASRFESGVTAAEERYRQELQNTIALLRGAAHRLEAQRARLVDRAAKTRTARQSAQRRRRDTGERKRARRREQRPDKGRSQTACRDEQSASCESFK